MKCKLHQWGVFDGVRCRCITCGEIADSPYNATCPGGIIHRSKLGDFVARRLESIGITKQRYLLFKIYFYLADPKSLGCKCGVRQEILNRFGEKTILRFRYYRARLFNRASPK